MKKKFLLIFFCLLVISGPVFAYNEFNTSSYYDKGLEYLNNYQYTSAIQEFKKALRENPQDLSSKIGLTNAYISRAAYYNNKSSEYTKAANDLRSALFYMRYYDDTSTDYNTSQAAVSAQKNLDMVISNMNADTSDKARFNTAKNLRAQGEFAASAYEYFQVVNKAAYQGEANAAIGDIMRILGQPQKSVFYFERAVKDNPNNADLRLKLARAYESIGNTEGAASQYNAAIQSSNEKEEILLSLEKVWQQKLMQNPNDAEAHANLGVVYQKQGKYDWAMSEYKKAEAINPSNVTTRLNLGTLYQYQKNYDGAIAAYNSILQLYPNHAQAHIYKAQCLKELGRTQDAISEYKLAMSYDPQNTSARAEMFDLLKSTMPTEQILAYLYQNVQNQPMNADTYYDFAYELHKANKLDDAIVYYNETIKLNPANVDSYINLSQVYRQKNNYEEALNTINKAKTMYPQNSDVKKQYDSILAEMSANVYGKASTLFEQGRYNEAIAQYNKIKPATAESVLGIAAAYQSLENYKLAIEYYKKAFSLDSTNADIPYYLGSVYLNLDDYTNAKTYLTKAITMDKTNEKAKQLLTYVNEQENNNQLEQALNFYDEKNYFEAMKILNSILQKDPKNGTAYYYRGLVFDEQKKYNLAVTNYQNALKYSPELSLAYYSLGVDLDILGRYQEAKTAYQKYIASKPEESEYTKYARKRISEIK